MILAAWLYALAETSSSNADVGDAYQRYVTGQLVKTDAFSAHGQSALQFVSQKQIEKLCVHLQSRIAVANNFALCHGTRSGRENVWFRGAWPGMQVWGTELSSIAAASAPWTTPWDFHRPRVEWLGQADFVYTNALDHSFNATLAISQWIAQTQPQGAVAIQWGDPYTHSMVSRRGVKSTTDIFAAGEPTMIDLMCGLQAHHGPLHVHKIHLPYSRIAHKPAHMKNWAYIIIRANATRTNVFDNLCST